jgi:amino acid transporter
MRFIRNMNPTLRGFLIIIAIVVVIMAFQLYTTLAVVSGLVRIAFFLAIAFFLFMLWRERRSDIEAWSDRSRRAFYAAALLVIVNLGIYFSPYRIIHVRGLPGLAWLLVFPICIYAMVRIWQDEHRYG